MIQKKMLQITNGVTIFLKEHSYVFQISIYTKKKYFSATLKILFISCANADRKKIYKCSFKKDLNELCNYSGAAKPLGTIGIFFSIISFWDFFQLNREQRYFLEID